MSGITFMMSRSKVSSKKRRVASAILRPVPSGSKWCQKQIGRRSTGSPRTAAMTRSVRVISSKRKLELAEAVAEARLLDRADMDVLLVWLSDTRRDWRAAIPEREGLQRKRAD